MAKPKTAAAPKAVTTPARQRSAAKSKTKTKKPTATAKPGNGQILMSAAELATLLDMTVQRVSQLVSEGTLIKRGRSFDLHENMPRYLARLRDNAAGRQGESEEGEKIDPIFEKAMKDRVERQLKEIQLSEARSQVVRRGEIMIAWGRVVAAAKGKLMSLATRLPTMIHGLTKKDIEIIQDEVRKILEELVQDGDAAREAVRKKAVEGSK